MQGWETASHGACARRVCTARARRPAAPCPTPQALRTVFRPHWAPHCGEALPAPEAADDTPAEVPRDARLRWGAAGERAAGGRSAARAAASGGRLVLVRGPHPRKLQCSARNIGRQPLRGAGRVRAGGAGGKLVAGGGTSVLPPPPPVPGTPRLGRRDRVRPCPTAGGPPRRSRRAARGALTGPALALVPWSHSGRVDAAASPEHMAGAGGVRGVRARVTHGSENYRAALEISVCLSFLI